MGGSSRETWSSELGLALSLIGVAVGLGNVWRFPYMLGMFGGASFLVIYLVLVLALGVPGLIAELSISRYVGCGPFRAFVRLGMPGGRVIGVILLVTALAAVAYYLVVIGWVLWYLILSVSGVLFEEGVSVGAVFEGLTNSPILQLVMHASVIVFCVLIVSGGVRRGIELASKFMMPVVYLVLVLVAVYVFSLPRAVDGLTFYLRPDWGRVTGMTVLAAMGQVFFSLGLGSTWIFIYGSYMSRRYGVVRSAVYTAFGDTLASFIAGLAILPLTFVFGVSPGSGPPLTFITLPEIFRQLSYGRLISTLFFTALLFAALLSAVPGFEIFIDALSNYGVSRRSAAVLMGVVEVVLGIPSILSIEVLLYNDLLWGSTMLPLASLFSILAFGWFVRTSELLKELNTNDQNITWRILYYWVRFAMPIMVILILIYGWISFLT
jgi:NSS family neurotransmitter:Na+ symporter